MAGGVLCFRQPQLFDCSCSVCWHNNFNTSCLCDLLLKLCFCGRQAILKCPPEKRVKSSIFQGPRCATYCCFAVEVCLCYTLTYDGHVLIRRSREPILLPLFLMQTMTAAAACLLYLIHASWGICCGREGGMENLNWVVSCLDLSKRMIFQEDGLYHLRLLWALLSLQPAWTAGPMLLLLLFLQRVSLCQTLQDWKCCHIC